MAGGGFRFGYYLGIYSAMRQQNKTPDLLLASCGGAIAAGIIQAFPDDAQRKAWICSPTMYQFWLEMKSSRQASIGRTLIGALMRGLSTKSAHKIPDLFNDYMFEIPAELPVPSISRPSENNQETEVAIIAGKLMFTENETGQLRGARQLFSEIVFCTPRAAALLAGMQSPMSAEAGGGNAIAPDILTDVNMPMAQAARASVSDMFYFRCHSYQGSHYIGGVIDLFPIEIATQLAGQVIMELKGPYDKLFSIPALRSVLGINGNLRLQHVLQQHADLWFDTSDMEQALLENQIVKKIVWQRNRIELRMPVSYEAYVKMIEAQWDYGFQRGLSAFSR